MTSITWRCVLAISLSGDVAAALRKHGSATLDEHCCTFATGPVIPAPGGPNGGVNGVAFSPNGKLLASIDVDGAMWLLDVSLFENPYTALCTDVGPPTRQTWDQAAPGQPFPKICT